MLIGHYGVALAARSAEKRVPLWLYCGATQFLDILWCIFIITGLERFRPDAALSGSAIDFTYYPFSHSLLAALAWSAIVFAVFKVLLRYGTRPALWLTVVVFSHWPLDWLVHRPDLALWLGGPRVGLGLWNYPVVERWLEVALVAAGAVAWTFALKAEGRGIWRAPVFALLLIVPFLGMGSGGAGNPVTIGVTGLSFYFIVMLVAWLIDRRGDKTKAEPAHL